MQSLCQEIKDQDFQVIGGQEQDSYLGDEPIDIDKFNNYPIEQNVKAVVVGQDWNFNYAKLCLASLYIQNEKAHFICTNDEANHHISGKIIPGAGAIIDAIQLALNDDEGSQLRKRPTVVTLTDITAQIFTQELLMRDKVVFVDGILGNQYQGDLSFFNEHGIHVKSIEN